MNIEKQVKVSTEDVEVTVMHGAQSGDGGVTAPPKIQNLLEIDPYLRNFETEIKRRYVHICFPQMARLSLLYRMQIWSNFMLQCVIVAVFLVD